MNKAYNLKRCFRRPQCTPAELDKLAADKNCPLDKRYMNTRRNGFVSAAAMCYNYHLPIIFDPNDVWLAVL